MEEQRFDTAEQAQAQPGSIVSSLMIKDDLIQAKQESARIFAAVEAIARVQRDGQMAADARMTAFKDAFASIDQALTQLVSRRELNEKMADLRLRLAEIQQSEVAAREARTRQIEAKVSSEITQLEQRMTAASVARYGGFDAKMNDVKNGLERILIEARASVEGKVASVEGKVNIVEGKAGVIEGKVIAIEGSIATRVTQGVIWGLGIVTAVATVAGIVVAILRFLATR